MRSRFKTEKKNRKQLSFEEVYSKGKEINRRVAAQGQQSCEMGAVITI